MDTQFDRLIDLFEDELRSGKLPEIETYLSHLSDDLRDAAVKELVALDVHYRLSAGDSVVTEKYASLGQAAVSHAEDAVRDFRSGGSNSSLPQAAHSPDMLGGDSSFLAASGHTIGPYRLVKRIGDGGMGTVWEAEQEEPVKRRVALKLIRSEVASTEMMTRFDAERQALSRMDHPNIARVLDAGKTPDGRPYLVMELINGTAITQYCDENRLSVDERLQLFILVCKAIQHAHQNGIIHRDLKPSNVLVTVTDGVAVPKVIDFGLAKAAEESLKLTNETLVTEFGRIVGTVQYMSPEQAKMNEGDTDTRTDIYSLGVMLYELLTGSTPLDRETLNKHHLLKILNTIREHDPPRPSTRLSSISLEATSTLSLQRQTRLTKLRQILHGELDWVVMMALARDRTQRYQTASEFAQDLSNYLSGEAVVARPPSAWYRLRKFTRRNRGVVASMTAIFVVLLAGIAGTGYGLIQANRKANEAQANLNIAVEQTGVAQRERKNAQRNEQLAIAAKATAEENARRAVNAEERALAESQRARNAEAVATFQLANARWDAKRAGEARHLLHQVPNEYRNSFEWNLCNRHFQGSDIACYGHTGWVSKVAFSPDGKMIASAANDSTIRLWNATTGEEITTLRGHSGSVGSVSFSPDGKQLASAGSDHTIKLWEVDSSAEVRTFSGHSALVATVIFSPDGKRLASASDDRTIKLWDVESGAELRTFAGHFGEVGCVAFSPDGARLASASVDRTIRLWNVETGEEVAILGNRSTVVIRVAFSPDGSRLASAGLDEIQLWDPTSGRETAVLRGHTQFVHDIAFSPDGTRLASGSRDRTVKLWDVRTGQEIKTFVGHADSVHGVAFSPDGGRIATASSDNTVKVWDTRLGNETLRLSGHGGIIENVVFSSDGNWLASVDDSSVRLWKGLERKEFALLAGYAGGRTGIALNPKGGQLAMVCSDGSVQIRELSTGQLVTSFPHEGSWPDNVVFTPDGTQFISVDTDGTVSFRDTETWEVVHSFDDQKGAIQHIAFHPDGSQLATVTAEGEIEFRDVQSLRSTKKIGTSPAAVSDIAFSPDGQLLAVASANSVRIWNTPSGEQIADLSSHVELVNSVAFAPDGTRLATAGNDKTIRLWDTTTFTEVFAITLKTDRVQSVAFSSDGMFLAAAGTDGKVRLWDARPELKITETSGHKTAMHSAHARFDPHWHREESRNATAKKDWYAATFHLAHLLAKEPGNAELREGLNAAYQQLASKFAASGRNTDNYLPPFIWSLVTRP